MEVSWQVTGIRKDAYANAHRIPVEEFKNAEQAGYYIHPQLFGKPEEKQSGMGPQSEVYAGIEKKGNAGSKIKIHSHRKFRRFAGRTWAGLPRGRCFTSQ